MGVDGVEISRPLPLDEAAHGDLALVVDVEIARIGFVLNLRVLLVIFHGVKAIAELVAPLIERGAGRYNLDEGEAPVVQRLRECLR